MFWKKEKERVEREKMKKRNILPQEIEVWYIIPAIRKEMAICLSKKHKLSYDKISLIMGLTKTAISQYVSGKRVEKIRLHPEAKREVISSCRLIAEKKSTVIKEIRRVLSLIKKKKLHCELCGGKIDGKLHNCKEIIIPDVVLEE